MAQKKIAIHETEASIIATMIAERDAVTRSITVAVNMALARHRIHAAIFVGLDGNAILMEVPDDELRADRPESPTGGGAVVGAIGTGPTAETPSESKPDGKKGHSSPVVEAPDVGKPDSSGPDRHPQFGGVGAFQHTEVSQ